MFFLLYNNFIPISLYVTIELVNVGQSLFIGSDINIYDETLDLKCKVRSSNLCQELGLVSNIFSDKTGTLTRNEMKLDKFIVDGQLYDLTSISAIDGVTASNSPTSISTIISLVSKRQSTSKGKKLYDFLRCLTCCHTVVRQKDGTYRAESPDELALVDGVDVFNCRLRERGTILMNVEVFGEPQQYEILAVNAFNADRKRMSILVKNVETSEYLVLCKGADNIMLPLCDINAQSTLMRSIEKSLLDLSTLGLRTLCIAQKEISEADAKYWLSEFKQASAALVDRSDKLAKVAAKLEQDMEILGITAIEDRLQDEVPEVIADLAKAGIILWMLTGDKEETAVNIGRSCNLLMPNTKLFFITKINSSEDYAKRLDEVYSDITANYTKEVGYLENQYNSGVADDCSTEVTILQSKKEIALVMDGPSFVYFNEKDLKQRTQLLQIGKSCRSVIACRLTPKQKQDLVGLVKKDSIPKAITLSIGDGANDVSMIREADVGIGIFGKEGRQAANNADFAIGQFKYLRRLLLVHGRWNYSRQARVFLYSMHKNLVITLTLYWFSYFSAVSGTSLYESWVYSSFNISKITVIIDFSLSSVLTLLFYALALGLPIIFYGIQDCDISAEFALKNPQVYSTSKTNAYLTVQSIFMWIVNAIIYAVVICLLYYYSAAPNFLNLDLYFSGTIVFFG